MKTKKTTKSSKKQVEGTAATKAAPAVASPIHEYVDSYPFTISNALAQICS
jgi:hypothetical protein